MNPSAYSTTIGQNAGKVNGQSLGELAGLERQMSELDSVITSLIARLEPVLTVQNEKGVNPSPPREILVPLAERLRSVREHAETITAHISLTLQRLEL
jgi:hypothetical protein